VLQFATQTALPTVVSALAHPTATPTNPVAVWDVTPPPTLASTPATPDPSTNQPYLVVDLSEQLLYAYRGEHLVRRFLVSTGDWEHPTLVGRFEIYNMYDKIDVIDPKGTYYFHDVPYYMQFWGPFAIHAATWHTDFGKPVSHGCVNMTPEDAGWVFRFVKLGTEIKVQY
jgi:lipoprotein-anchoring transpeptidase ErfK/SrfK